MSKKQLLHGFWQMFRGYWVSEQKWRAWGLLGIVIALTLASVYLLVLINSWYNDFYNALQQYQMDQFWPLVGKFTGLAFLYIFIAVYAIYLRQMLQIKWRTWMTDKYIGSWLDRETYYRLQVLRSDTDNPDQRISEDINQFVQLSLELLVGFVKQLTSLGAFGVVLWNLSGAFTVPVGSHEFVIYGYMFWFSLIYSIVGTGGAHLVGRKLIGLNFDQQRYEADFRFSMMRMRENSESIAFYHGEVPEGEPDAQVHLTTQNGKEDYTIAFYKISDLKTIVARDGVPSYVIRTSALDTLSYNLSIFDDASKEFKTTWQ